MTSFQRRYDLGRGWPTSYQRWNNVVCLQSRSAWNNVLCEVVLLMISENSVENKSRTDWPLMIKLDHVWMESSRAG